MPEDIKKRIARLKKELEEAETALATRSIEEAYAETVATHGPEIQAALNRAKEALYEAKNIAEKHGVPFSVNLGIGAGTLYYGPSKLPDLDVEVIEKISKAIVPEGYGWNTSNAMC